MVKQLEKSVCGSLRAGTIVIAVFAILSGLLAIIQAFLKEVTHKEHPTESPFDLGYNPDNKQGTSTDDEEIPEERFFRITQGVYGVIEISISVVLIIGAVKRIAKLVFPWVVMNVMLSGLVLMLVVILGIFRMTNGNIAGGLGLMLGFILTTLIQYYCILVVNSFHTSVQAGQPVPTA